MAKLKPRKITITRTPGQAEPNRIKRILKKKRTAET